MLDFLNKALVGIIMIVQTVGSTVGINQSSQSTPTPLPNLELIIASPNPSSTTIPTSKPAPTTNNEQKVSNTSVAGDGSRTGRIVKYKEYCKGSQEISVYESELISRKAADGITYSMTKDDWNCYDKISLAVKQPTVAQPNFPPCTVKFSALGYSKTYNYLSPEQCSYYQQSVNTTAPLPKIEAKPFPTIEPYKPSKEYTDAVAKWNKTISEHPTPAPLPTIPTPAPQEYGGCFGNCADKFTLEYKLNH